MFRNLSTVGLPLSGRPSELIEMALSFGFDSMDLDLVDFQQQAKVYGAEHAQQNDSSGSGHPRGTGVVSFGG